MKTQLLPLQSFGNFLFHVEDNPETSHSLQSTIITFSLYYDDVIYFKYCPCSGCLKHPDFLCSSQPCKACFCLGTFEVLFSLPQMFSKIFAASLPNILLKGQMVTKIICHPTNSHNSFFPCLVLFFFIVWITAYVYMSVCTCMCVCLHVFLVYIKNRIMNSMNEFSLCFHNFIPGTRIVLRMKKCVLSKYLLDK